MSAPILAELPSCSPVVWALSPSWADALAVAWQGKVAHYVFVGSAGAYNADPIEPMHFEGDKRKSSAGHVAVENYLADQARHPWRHYALPGCLVPKSNSEGGFYAGQLG